PSVPIDSITNNDKDKEFLSKMYKIIEDNISNADFSIDYLAKELCVSRSGLFAKIKGIADVTPNELIQIIRLKKAASMLLENKYQISDICFRVGFNSPSYFSKCFQKQFGMSPSEYIGSQNL
ncbi:MAG TPA: helix-turn-helix transcriptional regulator, partial [Xylanibacter oryzae]|nr:helix-turn-helix transcriptional regulator [Xylanibacter oryzae]